MKKMWMVSLLALLPTFGFAKVTPELQGLLQAKVQCTVVAAAESLNNQPRYHADTNDTMMISFNQIGGAEYTDAKCILAPAVHADPAKQTDPNDKPAIGGCFPLDSKTVVAFNASRLVMKRAEYNEVVDINFVTGAGVYTKHTGGCDWGRKCFKVQSEVRYQNCKLK